MVLRRPSYTSSSPTEVFSSSKKKKRKILNLQTIVLFSLVSQIIVPGVLVLDLFDQMLYSVLKLLLEDGFKY